MTKHSRAERARRDEENETLVRIQAAWIASTPPDKLRAFEQAVREARARPPQPPNPNMAPGTPPRPPRREPRPPKEPARAKRGR